MSSNSDIRQAGRNRSCNCPLIFANNRRLVNVFVEPIGAGITLRVLDVRVQYYYFRRAKCNDVPAFNLQDAVIPLDSRSKNHSGVAIEPHDNSM